MARQLQSAQLPEWEHLMPRVAGTVGDTTRPSIINTVREAQDMPFALNNLRPLTPFEIPANIPMTSQIPKKTVYLIARLPMEEDDYDEKFHQISTWILHLIMKGENNDPAHNLSLFFSSLCHYMPPARSIITDYVNAGDSYSIETLSLREFVHQLDAIDIRETDPDPEALCDTNNDKGRLVLGLNCLLIGKSINTNNHQGWFRKRVNSISGTLSVRREFLENFTPFHLKYCQDVYGSMGSHKDLRGRIFLLIHELTKTNNALQSMMIAVCNLLSGCEMTGFLLVYRVLLHENPELFYLYDLNSLSIHLQAALKAFDHFGSLRLYSKILMPADTAKVFNSPSILRLAKVAKAIAIDCGDRTLENYRMEDPTEGEEAIIERARCLRKLLSGAQTREGEQVRSALLSNTKFNTILLETSYVNMFPNIVEAINRRADVPQFQGEVRDNVAEDPPARA